MDFASSTRATADRTRWKGIVVKSSVVPKVAEEKRLPVLNQSAAYIISDPLGY